MADMIYLYLGLQKIKKFWSTPSVLLFLDANSKSRRFGRYLQKPVVSFMPSTATLIFFVIPRPPELIIDFAHGKSLVSNGLSQNKSCIPMRMVMCTRTHTHAQCSNLQSWPCFFQKHNSVRTLQKRSRRLNISIFLHIAETLKNKVT